MSPIYIIHWVGGDTDKCYGNGDLQDLLRETDCRIDGCKVMDGDRVVGRLEVVNG